jgi:hypothetical protein
VLQVTAIGEFDIRDSYVQPLIVIQGPVGDNSPLHEQALFRFFPARTG